MAKTKTVNVPDIGDFDSVDVIEVLVAPGDNIQAEDALITLESDKATMDIPAPYAGKVKTIHVKAGDKVAQGSLILELQTEEHTIADSTAKSRSQSEPAKAAPQADIETEVLVLGSGPGGYTAAFRAADLGKHVTLVERYPNLGGVCLNVGCIPSKALLHNALIIKEVESLGAHGIYFGKPEIDLSKLAAFKDTVIGKLTGGLAGMAKQRKVTVLQGSGRFMSPHQLEITGTDGKKIISFEHAIIAAGSQATKIPGFPHDDPRVLDSTSALQLQHIPKRMLVIGGGIIGLEMAMVYDALGSKITIVELMDGLIPGADRDLIRPLEKTIKPRYENIFLQTKVTKMEAGKQGIKVYFDGKNAPAEDFFDRVLVAVGRAPNGRNIGAENAGVQVNARGFIPVDKQQRTNVAHIFAIGDIVGQPMLAHKATHEGKVAAEVIAGHKRYFDARTIPSVAYTDPEVAWMGLTETEAKAQNIAYEKGIFPWAASGRALSLGRGEGMTKLLFDKSTHRILGAGIVGPNAGELIAATVVALEMGADIEDIALSIHPHPTLSETVNFAAEVAEGTITDLYLPKRK